MDGSDYSRSRNNDHLGINKIGKNIKKSPLHQPNFTNASRPQPQPHQVYNINKNDFRNIVQQLTGSPSQEPLPRPSQNPPRPPSMRLQKIRPPPLTPINRSQIPIHHPAPPHPQPQPQPLPGAAPPAYANSFPRPAQFGQPSHQMWQPGDSGWATNNTAESPISAYMRYLQNSMLESTPRPPPPHPYPHPHPSPSSGLLPNPSMPPLPSPRMNGPPLPSPRSNGPPLPSPRSYGPPFPSQQMNGPPFYPPQMNGPLPSPRSNGPPFPIQQMNGPPFQNGPPLLPSPTSQFLLPSPTGFGNLLSPRSPYPLLSPGYQFPPPMTPNFSFSPMAGILGPGPPSPGIGFPLSPSGFFPYPSPRWGDQ